MIDYYDAVLGLVPVSLLGVTGGLYGAGFELTVAVPVAAATAALVIGHGLFVNAPVDDATASTASTAATESPAIAAD